MADEGKIIIDDIEYKGSDLSDTAKALVQSLQYTEAELNRTKALVAVLTTARARYTSDLADELKGIEGKPLS